MLQTCPARCSVFSLALLAGLGITGAGCRDKLTSVPLPAKKAAPEEGVPVEPSSENPAAKPAVETSFTPRLGAVLALSVPVRSAPKAGASETGRVHCGDIVRLSARAGDWYKVELGEMSGYAHNAYVIELKEGLGRMPACEADHLNIKVPKDPKPVKLPTAPTVNKALPKATVAKADTTPAPDAVPAVSEADAAAPDKAAPDKAAPDKAAPDKAAPDKAAPDKAAQAAKPATPAKTRKAPENLELSTSGLKAEVAFPHLMHTKSTACAKCHHPLGSGSAPNSDKRCHDCHARGGKGESSVSNKDAFHRLCRDCHNTMGQGPTTCSECHVRK